MANIDHTNFTDIILLQSSDAGTQAEILAYCNIYEPQYLKVLMGSKMYYAFEAGKTAAPYKILLDGDATQFEWDGQYYKFDGIKRMIACLCYTNIIGFVSRANTKKGIVIEKNETSDTITPTDEIVRAWNEGVRLFEIARNYILYKSSDYPLYDGKRLAYRPA